MTGTPRAIAGIAALALAACGCGPAAPRFAMTGAWLAEYPAPGGDGAIVLRLAQSGARVRGSGAVRLTRGGASQTFDVSGTVADPDVSLNFTTLAGCPVSYHGRRAGSPPAYSRDVLVGRLAPSPCSLGSPTLIFRRRDRPQRRGAKD